MYLKPWLALWWVLLFYRLLTNDVINQIILFEKKTEMLLISIWQPILQKKTLPMKFVKDYHTG